MRHAKLFKSVLSVVLVLTMVMAIMAPMSAFAISFDSSKLAEGTYLTSKTDYVIAPGITESNITTNNATGTNQVQGVVFEIDLNNPTTSIISSYKNYDTSSWGFQKVRDQAYAVEAKLGVNVVAGVNGDFFNMQTGAPTGTFIMGGKIAKHNPNWPYFGITKDGKPVIGKSNPDIANLRECIGGPIVLLKDGARTPDTYTGSYDGYDVPRTAIGITADNKIITLTADGRQAPKSCGMNIASLCEAMLALGCVDALCLDGGGSATAVSQREGEVELLCRNSPSDGAEREVSSALLICSSARPTGEFHHAALEPNNLVYTPGSTVAFTAKGVDSAGSAAPLPEDGTFALADSSFGTIDPATGVFTSTGKVGTVTVNYMSAGAACGSVSIEVRTPDELYIGSNEQAVGPLITTDFGLVAKYQDRDVIMDDDDIIWTIVDNADGVTDLTGLAGTFNGLTFTAADDVSYNATVTATIKDTDLTQVINVFIGSKNVKLYDFEYTTDRAEAEATGRKYISSYKLPTAGSKYLSQIGENNSTISKKYYEQDIPLYMWPNGAIGAENNDETCQAEIVDAADGEPVRFGDKSLRIHFDFSSYNHASNANFYLRVTDPRYNFEGSPTAMGAWIYAPEGTLNYHLYLQCCDANASTAYDCVTNEAVNGKVGINWTGWKYVEINLDSIGGKTRPFGMYQGNGVFWISYQPKNMARASSDTIYIDDISLIYGVNTGDTLNPVINHIGGLVDQIEDGKTVYTSNTNTFKASYADVEDKYMTGINHSLTKMYIDGVDVTSKCFINEGDGEIYFYDAVLPDGVHHITVDISDNYGNKTSETRYFTIDSSSDDIETSFISVDEAPVLGLEYTTAIKTTNPEKIVAADVQIKVLSTYTSYWRDVTVVPAANYELDGEAVYNSVTDELKFKVVRKADADPTADDGIIANIVTQIPTNTPKDLEVTYRIMKGALTYTDEIGEKFTSAFSGRFTTTCISPYNLIPDTMLVGSAGGNIKVTDLQGNAVEGAEVKLADGTLLGTTDAEGKIFTDAFTGALQSYSIYAEKDGLISFLFTSQSFPSGGNEDGTPVYIKLNASENAATEQNISWMSSPLMAANQSVVLYATKAAYDAQGEAAFKTATGKTTVSELIGAPSIDQRYAVRFNSVTITGLTPDTEYVYKVGDGTIMSDVKSFTTSGANRATNFFVIGDTQATDTTNTDEITANLQNSGIKFDFGIQTGDAVDNGGNYSHWANIAKVFSGDFLGNSDLVHVLGNHEYYGDLTAHNAAAYFNLPGTEEDGTAPLAYSVTYGNIYVAAMTYLSSADDYAKAAQWLKEDASASNARWKILTMHQPTYYTNPGGGSDALRNIIAPVVDEVGIDFVFSGHDHSYARTKPMTAGVVDEANGAVYYICGSTGEKSYAIVNNPEFNFDALNESYNAIYLTVSATDTEFVVKTYDHAAGASEDALIDSYTMTKAIDCTEGGKHAYSCHKHATLICDVCGYTRAADGYDFDHTLVYTNGVAKCSSCDYVVNAYTGFIKNTAGKQMYLIGGNVMKGFYTLGNDHYYFDNNGIMQTGEITFDVDHFRYGTKKDGSFNRYDVNTTVTYTYGEDGKLVKGALIPFNGRYIYSIGVKDKNDPTLDVHYLQRGWHEIDGYWYYFNKDSTNYCSAKGKFTPRDGANYELEFEFDNNCRLIKGAWNELEGGTAYYWGPNAVTGLQEIDGEQYYFDPADTYMLVNEDVEINGKIYAFGKDGKFMHNGAHSFDDDGECSRCNSFFLKLTRALTNFFRMLRAFFKSLSPF